MEVEAPEQMDCNAGVAVTTGVGFTVIVTLTGVPEQLLAVGVIVYRAVPDTVVVAVNGSAIAIPSSADAPDTFTRATVQANIEPATLPVRAIAVASPEQMVCDEGVAVTSGVGFTVIV